MIKKVLEPFGFTFSQLQDIVTFLDQLEKNNITINDFKNYVKKEKVKRTKEQDWAKSAPKCKECEALMFPYPVNTIPGNQVGGDYKIQWHCSKCGYDLYSTKSIKDWIKNITENLSI